MTMTYFKETRKLKKDLSNILNESINSNTSKQAANSEDLNKKMIKPRKKRINNFEDVLRLDKSEKKNLLQFEHSDIHYKKRKIKKGVNHNMDMEEYYNKIENEINLDDVDYERKDMKKVWSRKDNKLTDIEIDNYLNKARIFWNYRNLNVENELCADFLYDLEEYMKENKVFMYNKGQLINNKILFLKKFLKNGIHLNCHFDEMALKILHICKYKQNVALLFLLKGLNPFVEEIEESFKTDVIFFQKEILSILSDDEN